jgi:tripartite ATP-independent transporter DctM subunit
MIYIAVISNISIGKLFLGGIGPGLLMTIFLFLSIFFISRKRNYPVYKVKKSLKEFLLLLKDTFFALLTPIIILLGVVLGIVTLVEVAVIVIFYILFISIFIYKSLTLKDIFDAFKHTAVFSASIMIIFAVVGVYQYIVVQDQLGEKLQLFLISLHFTKIEFLIAVNIFYIIMGCIIDAVPIMLIFFPILLPIAISLGIDPTHFGVITVFNLMIGLLTPPVGALLFIETKIANISFGQLVRSSYPYTIVLFIALFLCTFIPEIVMFIPNLVF